MSSAPKKDYVQLVCNATNGDYNSTKEAMARAKASLGITYSEYYKNKLYRLTPTQQTVEARKIIIRRNNKNSRFDKIAAYTGQTKSEIRGKINEINAKGIFKMTLIIYAKYEVYRYEGEELDAYLSMLAYRNQLKQQITFDFEEIDKGNMTYEDISDKMTELYSVIAKIMPESLYQELIDLILISLPHLEGDEAKCREAAIDMEATRVLLPFSLPEYVSFHFFGKSIEEKRGFISDKERLKILNKINDPEKFDLLDNKSQCYELLSEYYGRKCITASSMADYSAFKKFCKGKQEIVVKPPCDTMGNGIRKAAVPGFFKKRKFFKALLNEFNIVLVEELIKPSDVIRNLNPDSVNTVRVVTYYDGEKSIVHDSFMKVGQKGSFVDNGGAGGIFVHVNPKTGMLDSNGCDENGVIYETHPYTGVKFDGYQLPEWDKALALGIDLSTKIPGMSYIGWDFTYTADGKWIVVEGNAKTQFFGQQCTTGIGVREDFLKTIGYDK